MISAIGKKLQFTGIFLHAPNLVNLQSRNGWRVFAHPSKFSHWETLPALPHGRYISNNNQTLARVM